MMRKTGGTIDKRGDEWPQELAYEKLGWRRYGKRIARWSAEAQTAGEQAEADVGKRSGAPDDKSSTQLHRTESRIIPAPGGKDFLQVYNCRRLVDSAHEVIVARWPPTSLTRMQPAASKMDGVHRHRRCSPQGSIRRCWLLLGRGSSRASML